MLRLGQHLFRNPVVLAPMAGVTDVPFRTLAWEGGAGHLVGEMTGSRPELAHTRKTLLRREAVAGAVHAVQIAGTEPDWIAQAVRDAETHGARIVDINFGCPAKKVCKKAAGSALMADPERLLLLARTAVEARQDSATLITVKMRTGPTAAQRNAPELSLRLQDAGIAGLAIHGRTRACKFNGHAEYDTIAEVKRCVSVPVLANGDINTLSDAQNVLAHTAADGVMIGRAALGAPWLVGAIAAGLAGRPTAAPDVCERLMLLERQLRMTHTFYGETQGVRVARKHVQWTLGHPTLALRADERARLNGLGKTMVRAQSACEQLELLAQAFERRAA